MGEHLYTYVDPPNERHLQRIVDVLHHDGVVALPMGTNWAFAASPTSKKAEKRIRQLKPNHDKDRPFSLLCDDIAMASAMTWIDGSAYRVLKRLWPGPYTVLLKANHELPRLLRTKRKTVGVRIPADPLALAVVKAFEGPLMVSTVPKNEAGAVLTMGFEVQEAFGHGLDLVVDLGEPLTGQDSTVLAWDEGDMEIVRVGAGPVEDL